MKTKTLLTYGAIAVGAYLAYKYFMKPKATMASKIAVKTGIEEISFGNGGGFTGAVKTYKLTSECKLFEKETELKKVECKKTLELFNQAKELKDLNFNEPNNIYSFIEIKTKDKTNRIVWSFGSTKVDKNVIELYNALLTTTK